MSSVSSKTALKKKFESSEISITSGGIFSVSHGLGVKPVLLQAFAVCKTSEHGYLAGDEVMIGLANMCTSSTNPDSGIGLSADSENIKGVFGEDSQAIWILNGSDGTRATLTNGNWKVVIRAYA